MKFKIVVILLACVSMLSADAKVVTQKDVDAVNKGIAYLVKQSNAGMETTKLKRYFLAKEVKKPSFFSSSEPIYHLYLASFLQKGTPYWLEDDKFVLHTSSSKWYLKKLKKRYHNKYGIEVVVYQNPNYRQEEFKLTKIKKDKLIRYLKKQIPETLLQKKVKKEKVQEKKKEKKQRKVKKVKEEKVLPVIPATVGTKKEAKNVQRGIVQLKKQLEKEPQSIRLKRYFLAKEIEPPSIFGSMKPIYNLYLTSYLNKGTPAWLKDNKFVFHTSSSQKYLKRIQKFYKKKYHLDLTLHKNPHYTKEALVLAKTDRTDVIRYLQDKIPEELLTKKKVLIPKKEKIQEKKKEKKQRKVKRVKEEKVLPVIPATVGTKKEAKNVQRGIVQLKKQLEEETQSIRLKRYFLAKKIEKPSIFGSMKPIYNLYLTSYLNKGTPAWLEDNKFVFHTSSSQKYLKRIQKFYKKKYHLDLTLHKNPHYKKEALALAKIDLTDVIDYMKNQIPEALMQAIDEEKKSDVRIKERRAVQKNKRKIAREKKLERERKEAQKQMLAKKKIQLEAKRKAILEKEARQNKRKKLELKRQREVEKKRAKILEKARLEKLETIKTQKQNEKAQRLQEDKRRVKEEARREALAKEKIAANKKMQEEKIRKASRQKALEVERARVAAEKEKEEARREALAKEKIAANKKMEEEKIRKESRRKALEAERARVAAEKEKIEEEKKALAEEKRKIEAKKKALAEEKAAMAAEKRRVKEEKEKREIQRKKEEAAKRAKEAEKKRIAKQKKLEEEKKRKAEKKKKDDELTADLDAMLKDTKEFKKKLERSESIKYY